VSDSTKDEAEATFAAQRVEEGKKAMADYEMTAIAIRAKTERLRAMRLARDAEMAKTSPKPARKKKAGGKTTSGGKSSANSGTLSDWLDAQERGGHRA
jgi:hypothetical protein